MVSGMAEGSPGPLEIIHPLGSNACISAKRVYHGELPHKGAPLVEAAGDVFFVAEVEQGNADVTVGVARVLSFMAGDADWTTRALPWRGFLSAGQ